MATHDYVLANQSGSSFRSDLNNALSAIVSQNSSSTEPATKYSYQYWVDTSATPALIKQRNAANDAWITLGEVDGQLLIADGTNAKPGIAFAADINTGLKRDAADQISLVTAGTQALTILSDGKVGIGTTSPANQLQVNGAFRALNETAQNSITFENQADSTGDTNITIQKSRGGTGGPSQITAGDDLGEIRIRGRHGSDFANAFRIKCVSTTNTGNFAPNTTFTNNGTTLLTLTSSDTIQGHARFFSNASLAEGQNGYDIQSAGLTKFGRNVAAATTVFQVFGADGKFQLKGDGDAQNTNNSYGGVSDSKLKENIVDANSQWDDIKAIQVRNYNYKADTPYATHTQIGVIAQELETVCPGLVKDNIDEDGDGNDLGTVTKTVHYSVLYMKAVKALQEAMTRIETLETKVAALEAGN